MKIIIIAVTFALCLICISEGHAARVDNFCGDRYCGHLETQKRVKTVRKHRHHARHIVIHKEKSKKPIRVASLGETAISKRAIENGSLLEKAKSYLGTNPTGWRNLWCARFIAYIAPAAADQLKRMGLNPNWARDYAKLPGSHHDGKIGDIVVLTRGRGGHIGVVAGFKAGNPVIVSGNHGRTVGQGTYPARRVLAYVSL